MNFTKKMIGAVALTLALCSCCSVSTTNAQDEQAGVAQSGAKLDFSLFDVPDGKDVAFYKERLEAIQKALGNYVPTEEEVEKLDEVVPKASLVIFKNLGTSDEVDAVERGQYFQIYAMILAQNGNVDELNALLNAEKAKAEPDAERVAMIESILISSKIRSAGETENAADLKAAADELIEKAATIDSIAENALNLCGEISNFDEELGKTTLDKIIAAFKNSDNLLRRDLAENFAAVKERDLLISKYREALEAKDADAMKAVADELIEKAATVDAIATLAQSFCDAIARFDEELGKATFKKITAAFKNSDNPLRKRLAESFAGKERFDNLVGNDVLVEGLFLDGKEINWDEYRGKVVLIDFWATWCGPCRAEIPNVRALYEKYHDAGFEVVGYSVDDDLDALREFEENEKLPWKTMSEKMSTDKKNDQGEPVYKNLSEYYGVGSIPTMILVGTDGKAIDTEARGEHLKELREMQFPNEKERLFFDF